LLEEEEKEDLFVFNHTIKGPRVCVFITAGPITKLFAGGEEESGGHVL
jgi:hypothetical protein